MKIIETTEGPVRGIDFLDYTLYCGIPYAKPANGERRFRAPQAPDVHCDVFLADRFPDIAPQELHKETSIYYREFYWRDEKNVTLSEDCLRLNIWAPNLDQQEKLPVVVWIHGGGFAKGYGSEIEFDGAEYCRRGIILVSIQYRLGALGFLVHPWLDEPGEANGNFGLLDQIQALKWVHQNIEAFGGNPNQVTIMGQSAGSYSVQSLVQSPLTKGLFNRAIQQSAGGYQPLRVRDCPKEVASRMGVAFVKELGVKSVDELRSIPFEEIIRLQAAWHYEEDGREYRFAPTIDGNVLSNCSDILFESGAYADVSYLVGCTENDIGFTPEMSAKGEKVPLYDSLMRLCFLQEKLGRKPVYMYYFTRKPLGDDLGAFHSSELWYMFGTLGRSWRPKSAEDYELSKRMLDHWANFIKSGDPNESERTDWKPCTAENPYVQRFE